MRKKRAFSLLLVTICFLSTPLMFDHGIASAKDRSYNNVKVTKVVSGDYLGLEGNEYLKLIGIEKSIIGTPRVATGCPVNLELTTGPGGERHQKLTRFVKDLVDGKKVRLEFDVQRRDRWNNLLAYVFIPVSDPSQSTYEYVKKDNQWYLFLNATIIKAGYAIADLPYGNLKYKQLFRSSR